MSALKNQYEKIIKNKFKESCIKEMDIDIIEKTIALTDKIIDQIVYSLYGLTQTEQDIVEKLKN